MKTENKNYIAEDESGCFLVINVNAQSEKAYSTRQLAQNDSDMDEKAFEQCDNMADYQDMSPITWF